jgi:hypothetical protein
VSFCWGLGGLGVTMSKMSQSSITQDVYNPTKGFHNLIPSVVLNQSCCSLSSPFHSVTSLFTLSGDSIALTSQSSLHRKPAASIEPRNQRQHEVFVVYLRCTLNYRASYVLNTNTFLFACKPPLRSDIAGVDLSTTYHNLCFEDVKERLRVFLSP